jgi:hypothetical protein
LIPIDGVGTGDGTTLGSTDPVDGAWLGTNVFPRSISSKFSLGKVGESIENVVGVPVIGTAVVTMLGRAEGDSSTGKVGTVLGESEVATSVGIKLGAALVTMLGRDEGDSSTGKVGTVLGESEVATSVGVKLGAALVAMFGKVEGGSSAGNVGTVLGESEVAASVGTKLGTSDDMPVSPSRPNTAVGTMEGTSEGEAERLSDGASVNRTIGSTRVGATDG